MSLVGGLESAAFLICKVLVQQADIDLLPAHWYDMRARCTCPDDANPCKHMAAVYYLITSEIDKNPFTLFNLRGVDLMGYFNIKPSDTDPGYPLPLSRPLKPVCPLLVALDMLNILCNNVPVKS